LVKQSDFAYVLLDLHRLIRASLVLGAEVIAVGVETGEELAMSQPAGVQSGQGALWAAPTVADGTTAWSVDLDRPADEPWTRAAHWQRRYGPEPHLPRLVQGL
jgi:hypothetical protein